MEPGGRLHVDILKIPHHGSARNATGGLFDHITADVYVISADGRHGNPDPETLDWLMKAVKEQPGTPLIFATNWTESLRHMVDRYPPEQTGYTIDVLGAGETNRLL
jgi:beta-lactamase superfamily II metal-dependent hydrolase